MNRSDRAGQVTERCPKNPLVALDHESKGIRKRASDRIACLPIYTCITRTAKPSVDTVARRISPRYAGHLRARFLSKVGSGRAMPVQESAAYADRDLEGMTRASLLRAVAPECQTFEHPTRITFFYLKMSSPDLILCLKSTQRTSGAVMASSM